MAELPKLRLGGLAMFSTNPRDRMLTALIIKAHEVLLPSAKLMPIANFDTEPEARAWIQRRRDALDLDEAASRGAGS
jgi:hypothetical protein